jgi:hypothetical protein
MQTAAADRGRIGYLPVVSGGGNPFFQLVNARYERGAMILTSNRGFAEWGDLFGHPVVATALLDRLLHHAVVIHIEGAAIGCASTSISSRKISVLHPSPVSPRRRDAAAARQSINPRSGQSPPLPRDKLSHASSSFDPRKCRLVRETDEFDRIHSDC